MASSAGEVSPALACIYERTPRSLPKKHTLKQKERQLSMLCFVHATNCPKQAYRVGSLAGALIDSCKAGNSGCCHPYPWTRCSWHHPSYEQTSKIGTFLASELKSQAGWAVHVRRQQRPPGSQSPQTGADEIRAMFQFCTAFYRRFGKLDLKTALRT